MTREDFGMLVGEITDDEKKKADEEIREQQKQIDYDTKDYTIELLVQKMGLNSMICQRCNGENFLIGHCE